MNEKKQYGNMSLLDAEHEYRKFTTYEMLTYDKASVMMESAPEALLYNCNELMMIMYVEGWFE